MRIYRHKLSNLYKANKIRKKKIRITKIMSPKQEKKSSIEAKEAYN